MKGPGVPRVLVLSHLFPGPDNPALGCFVHEQVRALREHEGIDARVATCRPYWMSTVNPLNFAHAFRCYRLRLRRLRWEEHEGVPVVYLPYLVAGPFGYWLHGSTSRAAVRRAAPWLRRTFPFDLVHAHTGYPDGPAALALARRRGVPYVLTEHTNPFRTLMQNWLVRGQTLQALAGAARLWCVSSALADEVRGYLPEAERARVQTLPNGVDVGRFAPPAAWAPDPAAPRLVSVTALEGYKNPLLLLRAFRRLLGQLPGARLALVGAGPLEGPARAYLAAHGLADRVALLGRRTRAEVARLLREECDLLVLSSDSETFGVVLIEALASGKPVVCTDCGGPRDVLTDPALGELCPPGDETALAGALLRACRRLPGFDPRTLRRHAVEHFGLAALAARLAQEYRGLLGIRRRAAA